MPKPKEESAQMDFSIQHLSPGEDRLNCDICNIARRRAGTEPEKGPRANLKITRRAPDQTTTSDHFSCPRHLNRTITCILKGEQPRPQNMPKPPNPPVPATSPKQVNEEARKPLVPFSFHPGRTFEGKDLAGTDCHGAHLQGAIFKGADLYHANLTDCRLAGADLTNTNLFWADLTRADLAYADLQGANLGYADLTHANLTGADLTRADLTGANLKHANLNKTKGVRNSQE